MSDEELPVEYDMSFSTNSRINFILWKINQCIESDTPYDWLKQCKILLLECSSSMKEAERQEHQVILGEIERALNEFKQYELNYRITAANKSIPFNPPRKIFDLLYNWSEKLKKKLDKMGLLFRRADDAYSAMV